MKLIENLLEMDQKISYEEKKNIFLGTLRPENILNLSGDDICSYSNTQTRSESVKSPISLPFWEKPQEINIHPSNEIFAEISEHADERISNK